MTRQKLIPKPTLLKRAVDRGKSVIEWTKVSRPVRAFQRFTQSNGPTLSGGIAYTALFSLFGALTIGYTVIARVLGNNERLMESLLDTIDDFMPGLLKIEGNSGLIDPDSLIMASGLTLTTVVAALVLLWAALGCMSALRRSTRMMFDLPVKQSNLALAKLRELAGLAILGLSVVIVTVANITVTGLGRWVISTLKLPPYAGWLIPVGVIVVGFIIDALVFVLVVRILAGVQIPVKDKVLGALVSATGFGIIRQLGTTIVAGSVSSNLLVASFAVVVTLLLWINLSATIFLIACAFAANPSVNSLAHGTDSQGHEVTVYQPVVHRRGQVRWLPLAAGLGGYLWGRRAGAKQQKRAGSGQS